MKKFSLPQDYRDMLTLLNKEKCEYLMVGAYAMAAWGYVRATGDIDIWINPTEANGKRVFSALKKFGAPLQNLSPKDFSQSENVYQIGVPPLRIDILTSIDGVTFSEAAVAAFSTEIFGIPVMILSLDKLIQNKRATRREKDLLDAAELAKIVKE